MRYRKLDSNKDYSFGNNSFNFYVDAPEAVAQAVKTRLLLIEGEWFLDTTIGTPYQTQILGMGTVKKYDIAVQEVILNTEGVKSMLSYTSFLDTVTRALSIDVKLDTIYGAASLVTTL